MGIFANEIILKDGIIDYSDLLVYNIYSFKSTKIDYTIKRGSLVEMGVIYLSFDRILNTAKISNESHLDDTGIRFCADINENYIRLKYTSTLNGIVPIFKYNEILYQL